MALVERYGALMVATKVVKILDLVDPDDPVLAGKGLLDGAELGALCGKTRATDTVLGLSGGEQRVVVVVRHLVPDLLLVSAGVGGTKSLTSSCSSWWG